MLDVLTETALRLESGAHGVLPSSWCWDCRGSEGWRGLVLWAILEGTGRIEEDGRILPLGRGDVFLMRFDHPRRGRHDPAHPLVVPWCVFDLEEPAARRALADCPASTRYHLHDIDFGAGCLRRAVDCAQQLDDQRQAAHWLRSFFRELARPAVGSPTPCADERSCRIERLAEEMRKHPERRTPLPALAHRAGYDPDHLSRVFRRRFGLPPGRFAIRCRIDRARTLLRFTDLGVGVVAARLGYQDPYFFSRQFKAVTGVAPSVYRQGG